MGMTLLQPTGGVVAPEVPMVLQAEFQTPWFFPAVTGPPWEPQTTSTCYRRVAPKEGGAEVLKGLRALQGGPPREAPLTAQSAHPTLESKHLGGL